MKDFTLRLFLAILIMAAMCVTAKCQSYVYLRPTTDADTASSNLCSGTNVTSTSSMAAVYTDKTGSGPQTPLATQGITAVSAGTRWRGRVFQSFQSGAGNYGSLALKITYLCTVDFAGQCGAEYTTNGGTTWNTLVLDSGNAVTSTASVTLPTTTSMSSVQVRICEATTYDVADSLSTSTSDAVTDIWIAGTVANKPKTVSVVVQ